MIANVGNALFRVGWFLVFCTSSAFAQGQTTGRIAGTVKDENGAVIVRAEVAITSRNTAEQRTVTTDHQGNYNVPLLAPGTYRVRVTANGFRTTAFESVRVALTETTTVN